MGLLVLANEATAAQRRVYFDCRDATDGITAETGENGGQPQISINGAAWTNTGIGVLNAIGSGRYYADLTSGAVATAGDIIQTRFKSANTAETPGDSVQVVALDFNDAASLGLSRLDVAVSTRSSHTAADTWAVATRTLSAAGVQAIWDALTSALTVANSIGKRIADNLDATISSRLASTSYVAPLDAAGTRSAVGLASADLDTQLAALPDAAQINAEVVDALNVDTYAEPGQEVPPATTSLVKKIGYLFKLSRNKVTQDATELKVYADDGTTVDQKSAVSDTGTLYTRGELGTGP